MANNVKPGDRAIVVRANHLANLSIVCDVIRQAQHGEEIDGVRYVALPTDGLVWVVESLGRPFMVPRAPEFVELIRHQVWICSDKNLRRLEPPEDEPTTEHATDELKTPATLEN